MKKTLSFVLVLALVLSSFSMAFAGTTATAKTDVPTDVVGTAFEAPVTVLTALGVVNGYEDGTYKPSSNVTRAEFAKLIIAELGLEANAQSSKSTFTDMSGAAWADGYVGYAASLGIINGYGDGRFGPSDNVTYDQALTMIVRALGYTSDCKEMNGTWPAIYVQKANVLGITDDISNGGSVAANRGDVALMLYNTLTCDMGYANDEGTFVTKKDKDGDTIKVASNLDAEESEDYKVITKSDADNAVVNIRQYVGAYAKVFTLTSGDNEDDIIAVSDVKSDFVTGEFKLADKVIETADGTEYKLDDIFSKGVEGTSTYLDSDWTAYEFENGDTATAGDTILTDDQDALDKTTGTSGKDGTIVTIAADLSGKTIKGIYSVAKWTIDTDELVDADDIADIASNKTLLGKDFSLDDDDAIDNTSFELVGVKSLSDIKADNVVYVYTAGSDDEITRVAVGATTATGEVTAIKEDDSNAKATINGNVYKFAKQKLTHNGTGADFDPSDIDTEDEITAYLDAYGYMYDYDLTAGGADNYAVVLEAGQGTTGIGSNHEIKLFLADGTDKVFDVDDDLFKADDYVPGVTTLAATPGNGGQNGWEITGGAIVKYGLDKDGVIDSFEEMTDDYELVTDYNGASGSTKISSITEKGYYANEQIREDAVMFSSDYDFDARTNDEDDYAVTTLDKVLDTDDVNATYVLYKDKIAAMLLFDYSGSDETYGVVTEAKKTSGDSDYQATFFVDGKEVTYGIANSTVYNKAAKATDADAAAGADSVFKLSFNASGEVNDLTYAWTDGYYDTAVKGDTYATAEAILDSGDSATYSNNTFKFTDSSDSNKVYTTKMDGDVVIYKNDDGDFKVGGTSDLKNLNAGAHVYFYDTADDSNDGLMTLVYIYNTDSDSDSDSSSTITDGVYEVTYVNSTRMIVNGTTYSITDDTKLYDVNGTTVLAMGGSEISNAGIKGDSVTDISATSSNVLTKLRMASTVTTLSSATMGSTTISTINPTNTVDLAYGTTTVPTLKVTSTSKNVDVAITQATTVGGTATVVVTPESGTAATYTFKLQGAVIDTTASTVTPATNTVAVDADTITIKLVDTAGRAITDLASAKFTITQSGAASASTVTIGTVSETATDGTYEVTVTNTANETVTYTVKADGVTIGTSAITTN